METGWPGLMMRLVSGILISLLLGNVDSRADDHDCQRQHDEHPRYQRGTSLSGLTVPAGKERSRGGDSHEADDHREQEQKITGQLHFRRDERNEDERPNG